MVTQTVQGKVTADTPSAVPVQQQISPEDLELLQLDNMDQDTSPVRRIIMNKIEACLKKSERYCNFRPYFIRKASRIIDRILYETAPQLCYYMDPDTVEVRVNNYLRSLPYRKQRDPCISSTVPSTKDLRQLPGIQMTDSSVYHNRVAPAFTNLPAHSEDVPPHTAFTSQRYVPQNPNMSAANFALAERPESFMCTIVVPSVSVLPNCISGLCGIDSAGLQNGYLKDHFPGDAYHVDSPRPSMPGSSSPLSAACDRTTSLGAMIRSSMDISKASGQKLFTGEGQLFQQYREYKKELDGAWSHPAEKAVHSNRTTQSNEIYVNGECGPDTFMKMKENYWRISDSRNSCREIYSNLSTANQCFVSDCDPCDPEREIVERSEQTPNSTVSKTTSPISDESSDKRPAKRLKAVMEEKLYFAKDDIEMREAKTIAWDQTPRGVILSSRRKRGASILYGLTVEELGDHMSSLINPNTCLSKETSQEFPSIDGLPDQNTCSLCGMERLLFEPPPRFCALCFKIINSAGCYYVEAENGSEKTSICSKCHHLSTSRAKYQKKFNYAETDAEAEWWVQCDKCKAWQHEICALFNRKCEGAKAEYTCAKCFLNEKDSGDIQALEPSTVLGAQELPRTKLSDHIEQRLSERLEQDRQHRASASGKVAEEVPGVNGLTVRVVSSADRLLQVQPRFRDLFKQEKYPGEFPYRSKAILLFQKIEGVDVCLFVMYVQEYGSDCPSPNQRHVYLAYIDSVKYLRPEIKSASGEALRTFVYHEILIGYLDYCKKRGFVSCSIWACPSTKRDDYVLYCHPTVQKMPKSDKLRSWYQNLIKKAVKEGIVVERNTLSDFFLQPTNECKANISAACLPYCENDFWPGEAERLLEKDDNTSQKKETQVGRLLRVAKRYDRKGNPKDILLVHKLGERLRTMKEDFIMLCLQQLCKHCHQPIVSGKSWVCTSCKNFHLCAKCHAEEQNRAQKDRHPATTKQKHAFQRMEVEPLPETDDGDPTMESKYFDSRVDFLKHCQDNQFQFDTLRRAKHSTMMILYYLHSSICSACHRGVDQCLVWRCLECMGCTFCDQCYKQDGPSLHNHELRQVHTSETSQQHTQQDYVDGLVHASRCRDSRNCTSPVCLTLKKLFFHGVQCGTRARNRSGCDMCLSMWKLLLCHSKDCNDVDCPVPRCRDMKAYIAEKLVGPVL